MHYRSTTFYARVDWLGLAAGAAPSLAAASGGRAPSRPLESMGESSRDAAQGAPAA